MIKEISSLEALNFLRRYFPNYNLSNDPYEKVFGFTDSLDLIGVINVSIIYERVEINYIAVLDEYRRKGIGSKLLNYICDMEIESVSLEVKSTNKEAIDFYLANSFDIAAVREKYYNGIDGYLMVKEVR